MKKPTIPNKSHSESSSITIAEDYAGQRIDNFLFKKLRNVPKSRIYKMLRKGEVRVNKKRIHQDYKIQANDIVRIPPFWSESTGAAKTPSATLTKLLLDSIAYEDQGLIIINKPAKVAAHGGSGINFGAIETMRHARPDLKDLELVHRLDRDTSGCLMLAKKHSTLRAIHGLIREGLVKKTYLALLCGQLLKEQEVNAPIMKNQLQSGERVVKVSLNGKKALTVFKPLKIYKNATLVEIELHTGRTHQIRVHAAYIGHPVAGDEKYGDKDFNSEMKQLGLNRLFLHAKSLHFYLPTGKLISVSLPLSPELANVCDQL